MASAQRASRGDSDIATFAVDRLDVQDGQLLVEGRWSGVRGMRFLRPTLVVDGRQVLATLEHKPWAPREDGPWTAAFPWTRDAAAPKGAYLEVAPSVIVPLGPAGGVRPPVRQARVALVGPQPDASAAVDVHDEPPEAGRVPKPEAGRAGTRDPQLELEDLARAARAAEADRDRALAMRDEAVRDREAALRTRDRMGRGHDAALEAVVEAQRRRDAGVA
ncbi:MAG: hypothetical protein JWM93_825, partial [Frankiales bacterium]|nr:hypothetical protein [Frankiales bacterium]